MFDQVYAAPSGAGRAFSTMAGLAMQGILLTTAVLIPMVFPEALPRVRSAVDIFAPGPPPPPPGPLKTMLVRTGPRTPLPTRFLIEPGAMPARAIMFVDAPPAGPDPGSSASGFGVPGGAENGVPGGVLSSLFGDALKAVRLAPAPAVAQAAAPPKASTAPPPPVRIVTGGDVQEAKILHRVMPVYPPLARQARISGKVELHGVIGVDGRIRELRALAGHPLLIPSALDAVRQWTYRPTHLNGVPVEVEAPITVNFTLSGMY